MDIGVINKLSEMNKTLKNLSIGGGTAATNTLLDDSIQGTTSSLVLNEDGTVERIQYKDSTDELIREDVFTYEDLLITEVRTKISDASSVTLKYHLDSLNTEII